MPGLIGVLAAMSSGRGRVLVVSTAAFSLAGRVAVLAAAFRAAAGDAKGAAGFGLGAALVLIGRRVLQSSARVVAERDLYRVTSRAVLKLDVLRPLVDTRRVFEGVHQASEVWSAALPGLVADAAVCVIGFPIVLADYPRGTLLLTATTSLLIVGVLFVVRNATRRLEERMVSAREDVARRLLTALEARLELVASGHEDGFRIRYERLLERYEHFSRRAAVGSALLGRAPLAAGALAAIAIVLFDERFRAMLERVVLLRADVLVACVPPLTGFVLGANRLWRTMTQIAPWTRMIERARRVVPFDGDPSPVALPTEVVVEGLTFAYGEGKPPVLEDVSFVWPVGAPLVLGGGNGSGKSTLLRLLIGLRPPTRGAVRFGGQALTASDAARLRSRAVLMPQRPYLGEPRDTVRSAVQILCPDVTDEKILVAFGRVGVLDALRHRAVDARELEVRVGELSSGQRQRVALARLLLQDASIVLLDEPDANLDQDGVALVKAIIDELVAEGKMVAVAAHSTRLVEMKGTSVMLKGASPVLDAAAPP